MAALVRFTQSQDTIERHVVIVRDVFEFKLVILNKECKDGEMERMQKRKFGNLGYEVSLLGMGCMRLPRKQDSDGGEVDREKAYELIRYAAASGINYFDTAMTYHSETSEEVLGEALDGIRKTVHVATKQPVRRMLDVATLRKNLEDQLTKLRTDYLDLYLFHGVSSSGWKKVVESGYIDEFARLKEEGLIRGVAFSFHGDYENFEQFFNAYDWDMCQIQQNLMDVDKEVTEKAIHLVGRKGAALVIMEPLRGGGLAAAPKEVEALYQSFSTKRTPVEWAFRHLYNYPEISCILSGMTTMEQLKENIRLFSSQDAVPNSMSAQEKELIQNVRLAYEQRKGMPCTGCEYCMPCPAGVSIPRIFSLYNNGVMFEQYDASRRRYFFLSQTNNTAENCVECGNCVAHCPQYIDIPEQLKVADEILKGWNE